MPSLCRRPASMPAALALAIFLSACAADRRGGADRIAVRLGRDPAGQCRRRADRGARLSQLGRL